MTVSLWPPRGPSDWRPPHWTELALCAEIGDDFWFPEKGGSTREAKRVCRSCEVQSEGLKYALETDQRFGIWGGMSERDRRLLKRQSGHDTAAAVASVIPAQSPQPREKAA